MTANTPFPFLIDLRKAVGLSRRAAAERFGVSDSTFAAWEKGQRVPQRQYRERVIHYS